MNKNERKAILKEIALKNFSNGGRIYQLIEDGCFDKIIKKINDEKTFTNSKAIVKKGYLTGNEQFLDILNELIFYFESSFLVLQRKDWFLSCILENKIPEFLLCKKYWGDNNHIPYFQYNMRKLFVENAYNNILYIYDEHTEFFKKLNITKSMDLSELSNVNILYYFIIELIWCNCNSNQYSFNSIFSNYEYNLNKLIKKSKKDYNDANKLVKSNYSIHWEMLIKQYNKNIKTVKLFLK